MLSSEEIPNNVDLATDKRLQRALLQWRPRYLDWWMSVGPDGFQQRHSIYLRTAVGVHGDSWAHFEHVHLPDYRWGIFLADPVRDRCIGFGDLMGQPVWQDVPGEFRSTLRRLIVTQGDTEPASVEQQRLLGHSCPSQYDLRNLFQVNVEEGRHLWAMVYLLHTYFGRDGREEAEGLLERRSGDPDKPRILGAFNHPITNWLDFFMFAMFVDRDGKLQLMALAESAFDPLSRTTRFMLTEEAHHMFVGETGVGRILERSCQLLRASGGVAEDVRANGGIDIPTIQKYLNRWCSLSVDLFGSEISTNAASYFASGLKGRAREERYTDHVALDMSYPIEQWDGVEARVLEVPLRNAMNEVLRDSYLEDCEGGVLRWNRILERYGFSDRLRLPDRRFNRHIGVYSADPHDPSGKRLTPDQWLNRQSEWLPSADDMQYINQLMSAAVCEPGQYANWIAPPAKGINGNPAHFEYVRTDA